MLTPEQRDQIDMSDGMHDIFTSRVMRVLQQTSRVKRGDIERIEGGDLHRFLTTEGYLENVLGDLGFTLLGYEQGVQYIRDHFTQGPKVVGISDVDERNERAMVRSFQGDTPIVKVLRKNEEFAWDDPEHSIHNRVVLGAFDEYELVHKVDVPMSMILQEPTAMYPTLPNQPRLIQLCAFYASGAVRTTPAKNVMFAAIN